MIPGCGRVTLAAVLLLLLTAAAVGAVSSHAETGAQAPSEALSGEPWTGRGARGWSEVELEAFAEFPILWLGPSYAGLNLQQISRQNYIPLPPVPPFYGQNSVSFSYGDCAPVPCTLPVDVEVREICTLPPSFFPEPKETVRGEALVQRAPSQFGGRVGFMLWTGRNTVSVSLPGGPAALEEALAPLHSPGAKPAVQPGDLLPPPDESECARSVWEERVIRRNRSVMLASEKPVPAPERAAAWTGFAEDAIALPLVGDSMTITVVVRDLPAGVSGVHLAVAHPAAVRIETPRCDGPFVGTVPMWAVGGEDERVSRFPDEGVSVVGCFVDRGTDATLSGAVMQLVVTRIAAGEATLSLAADPRLITRYFANGFAVGPGSLGELSIPARSTDR